MEAHRRRARAERGEGPADRRGDALERRPPRHRRLDLRARRPRGGRQPRAAPLLLRHQGGACWSRSSAATPSTGSRGSTSRSARPQSVDELLEILVADLEDSIQNDPGFWVLLFDLFTAGRRNPEIQREVAELFNRTRAHVAEILRAKQAEGVISPRFDADAVVALPVRARRRDRAAGALRPRAGPHRRDRRRDAGRAHICWPASGGNDLAGARQGRIPGPLVPGAARHRAGWARVAAA